MNWKRCLRILLALVLILRIQGEFPCVSAPGGEEDLKAALSAVAGPDRAGLQTALNRLALEAPNSAEASRGQIIRAGAVLSELILNLKLYKGCIAMQRNGVAFKGCFDQGFGFQPFELALALSDMFTGSVTSQNPFVEPFDGSFLKGLKILLPQSREKEYGEIKNYVTQLEQGQVPQATLSRIEEITYSYWLNKIMGFIKDGFVDGKSEQRALFYSVAGSLLIEAYELDVKNDELFWLAPNARAEIFSGINDCLEKIRAISKAQPENLKIRSLLETTELEFSNIKK